MSSAPPPPAPSPTRRFVLESRPLFDLDEDTGPAPCDFDRSYRGKIGESTPVSLVLRSSGASLDGLDHYDLAAAAIHVAGMRTGNAFVISEKGGGTFTGTCDAKGVLRGEFLLGKKREPFELAPRLASWPGLYRVTRTATAEPHHPQCKTAAKPDVAVEIDDQGRTIICLPTNPQKRKALLAEAPSLLCSATDSSFRVFGLADAALETKLNELLAATGFDVAVKDIRRCSGTHRYTSEATLVTAHKDLLVVSLFRSDDYGGMHPLNFGGSAYAFDLALGTSIHLQDLVDVAKLRGTASACLPVFAKAAGARGAFELDDALPPPTRCGEERGPGQFLWGCSKDDIASPIWALVPEGIVIGSWANPHASAADDGKGPILPWSVLLRDGVLKSDSRFSKLWSGAIEADPSAPACSGAYEGSSIVTWREASR